MMASFIDDLVSRLWDYQQKVFSNWDDFFERPRRPDGRPPVFLKKTADYNVLTEPHISVNDRKKVISEIPIQSRHRWFRSMKSSQAIAQSVFANLKIYNKLHYLSKILCDHGDPLFENAQLSSDKFFMEYEIDYLDEPRRTNLDCFVSGHYKVAVECKLTETRFGNCSRPRLKEKDSNFEADHCDGSYVFQRGRKERCSLTEIGVLYWRYIPAIFKWQNDIDYNPCPIIENYQLVRNVLAASVDTDGVANPKAGHVVVVYDARNSAFQRTGEAYSIFHNTRRALKNPKMLRKCSWQRIIDQIREEGELDWLVEQLELKYGF